MKEHKTSASLDLLKDAKQLYAAHRNAAIKPSKVSNLDKVWQVLNELRDEGSRDYSLAEIGRRLAHLDGPKTQSLRNAQGSHYRDIISAFANAMAASTRYLAKTKSNVDQALESINDPSTRSTIRVALDEARRLKVVNDNLHAAFKSIHIGTAISPLAVLGSEPTNGAVSNYKSLVSPRLLSALKKGIDSTRLAQQGLRISEDGSIENEHGDKLFPPAFADAIMAVLSSQN